MNSRTSFPGWAVHDERPPLVQGVDQSWRQGSICRPSGILPIGQCPEESPPDLPPELGSAEHKLAS